MLRMMYEGHTMDVTLLDFAKAFDRGVPYGSITGPPWFLIFVNDLSDVLEAWKVLLLDDVKNMNVHRS